MQTALFWHKTAEGKIQCELCPHHCLLGDKQTGRCGIRQAQGGELQARGYGLISSIHNDPIEKKPLYHFRPGRMIFSVGGWGCNLACQFCQNWSISQEVDTAAQVVAPGRLVQTARDEKSIGIAYTYNEPLINLEYVQDCARLARQAGLVNVLVTNGYVEEKPAAGLLTLVDALNIDIKSMEDSFYKKVCRGTLEPVLHFSRQAVAAGCHVEITNLLIPSLNDSAEQVGRLAGWMAENLGKQVPLHLSAYHPDYRLNLPPTPLAVLKRAWDRCRQELDYVYMGNVASPIGQQTACPKCGHVLIRRHGYQTDIVGITNNACVKCGRPADVKLNK